MDNIVVKRGKGRPKIYTNEEERKAVHKENMKKARLRYYYRHTIKKADLAKYQEWLATQAKTEVPN